MHGMLTRWITAAVREGLEQMPAVALLGARQVGKTTLAKILAKRTDSVYLDGPCSFPVGGIVCLARPHDRRPPTVRGLEGTPKASGGGLRSRPPCMAGRGSAATEPRSPIGILRLGLVGPALAFVP